MFLSPIVVLLVLALVGASWSGDRWRRTFRSIGIAAVLVLITVAMTPLGLMAAAPLENRFPQPAADMPPPFGIIVLGGAVNGLVSKARGEIVFDEGERMIEAAFLAKRYPQARVVFTGGSGSLIAESKEAPAARELLIELGVDPDRIIVEDKSRNTDENARFTAAIVHPEPKQRWLLVTSAFHMPRAIGVFEKAGFDVVADPVAYRTLGPGNGWQWDLDPGSGFRIFETAVHEWIGLAVYRATGRIDSLFPGFRASLMRWQCAARSRHRQTQPRGPTPGPRPKERFHNSGAMGNGSMLTAAHQNAERATFLTIAAFRSGRFAVLRPLGLDLP